MGREPLWQPEEENFWNGWRSADTPVPGAGDDRAVFLVLPMCPARTLTVTLLLRVAEDSCATGKGGLVWGRMCYICLVCGHSQDPTSSQYYTERNDESEHQR